MKKYDNAVFYQYPGDDNWTILSTSDELDELLHNNGFTANFGDADLIAHPFTFLGENGYKLVSVNNVPFYNPHTEKSNMYRTYAFVKEID